MPNHILTVLVAFFLWADCFAQSDYPFRNTALSHNIRINDLLGRLTIEERVSLLITNSKNTNR